MFQFVRDSFGPGQFANFFNICCGGIPGSGPQCFEHFFDGGDARSHLLCEAHLGIIVETKQLCLLLTQGEDAVDILLVVEFAFRCASDKCPIELLTKFAAAAVLHERKKAGAIKRESPRA